MTGLLVHEVTNGKCQMGLRLEFDTLPPKIEIPVKNDYFCLKTRLWCTFAP
jgi:hypothetical protein